MAALPKNFDDALVACETFGSSSCPGALLALDNVAQITGQLAANAAENLPKYLFLDAKKTAGQWKNSKVLCMSKNNF